MKSTAHRVYRVRCLKHLRSQKISAHPRSSAYISTSVEHVHGIQLCFGSFAEYHKHSLSRTKHKCPGRTTSRLNKWHVMALAYVHSPYSSTLALGIWIHYLWALWSDGHYLHMLVSWMLVDHIIRQPCFAKIMAAYAILLINFAHPNVNMYFKVL